MNTRALMELIVINLGYDLGSIPKNWASAGKYPSPLPKLLTPSFRPPYLAPNGLPGVGFRNGCTSIYCLAWKTVDDLY